MTMTARRLELAIGAAVLVALAGTTLPACSSASQTPPPTQTPISVEVATVALTDIVSTFEGGGVVQAQTTATIMARILAPVREVRVVPGDHVRAGQLLVALDARDLVAQAQSASATATAADHVVTAAVAEQEEADAALALARTNHERIAGLHAKRSATAQELDDSTGALRAAEARAAGAVARAQAALSAVKGARAASEAARATSSFALITAPFDGVITEKMVEQGNMAAPGTPLMRLEDTRGFRLDVRVDESRIGQITLGATVPVSIDSGFGGESTTVSGTVTEIGRAVDADARAFLVKITLPDTGGLRSGKFGRARFRGQQRRALTVPAAALTRRGQITSVFVLENDLARLRLVNVSGTEVLAGLAEGEMVIVAAPPSVTDGSRVSTGGR